MPLKASTHTAPPETHLLVISHEASRTGAVIVLLHLLRHLHKHCNYRFTVVLYRGGELETEFRQLGDTHIWQPEEHPAGGQHGFANRIRRKIDARRQRKNLIKSISAHSFNAVYVNTTLAARIVPDLIGYLACPIICHVHELETVLQTYCRLDKFRIAEPFITQYIACAEAVKSNLILGNHVAAQKRVDVVYECISVADTKRASRSAAAVRHELDIPEDAFVVGGSGLVEWRKGADLFIMVAHQLLLARQLENTCFVWVGHLGEHDRVKLTCELKNAGLEGRVIFTGQKNNPQDYYQLFDVFTLTSREDPFPLVVLEAAGLGKPILCFERAGGIPEFIAGGGGISVPYADIGAMAAQIVSLRENPERLRVLGTQAAENAKQYDVSLAGGKIDILFREAIERHKQAVK